VTLWGGRFSESPDAAVWQFTVDTADRRLLMADITGSIAHVTMLGEVGLLAADEVDRLLGGLEAVVGEAADGSFAWQDTDEDVHTAVERRLGELVGAVAGKLHTGRSRNDQVCLDLRLYLREAAADRREQLHDLARTLADKAEQVGDTIVPAYTHLQQAQAVPLAHHLLAYAFMVLRDAERFADAGDRIAVSPLGAGAAGGSSLPLDPHRTAELLGLPAVFDNSLDAVGSRDFAAEYVFACSQAMVHLSRLAEDLILWATEEFGWATYSDRYTTGSSALPQKKNPDVAELARGKAATVIGDLTALLSLQKGLPLTYNRDLQEDKRAVFHADDTLAAALPALAGMIESAEFHPPAPSSWTAALDVAEILVERGVPFREAHEAVGRLVADLVATGRTLVEATAGDLERAHPHLIPADVERVTSAVSVAMRTTPGGGSLASVAEQIESVRATLSQ
jgi:argininosuccinate lyase